ncbi:hypothetical protein ASPZODRAFT_19206 [Penicilliopsis zonata CBS 506.65]|uniref:Uncharacterized protein n=1 Tax=Penicilliopsis zonata CBS 506.65 TaxID=1073090 RepID=A0A1L9S9V5_9EURO|nr:hypothetical protein ASPZODRAFT_19206 [Penicilliopsis zonata CBS 506.65]OJJ43906.1 hypothetical protein ASPZODRAFT_19206 [Penicilliopsis zonata CBS 506.65]
MEIQDCGLGDFGNLPPEMRSCIWDHLCPHDSTQTDLSILRASKCLHEEISHHFYSRISLDVNVSPKFERLQFLEIYSRKWNKHWFLPTQSYARRRGFQSLPYHKVDLTINIHAPNPRDPGQMITLWKRMKALSRILQRASKIKSLKLCFQRGEGKQDWQGSIRDGQASSSIRCGDLDIPDYFMALIPLCSLKSIQEFQISADCQEFFDAIDWSLINSSREFILKGVLPSQDGNNDGNNGNSDNYLPILDEFRDISHLVAELSFMLDLKLDDMDGHTANMLRLDRFSRWFRNGRTGLSPYQRQIRHLLHRYPDIVRYHDPFLADLRKRHIQLVATYHVEFGHGRTFPCRVWDSAEWDCHYPRGIDPLRRDLVQLYWEDYMVYVQRGLFRPLDRLIWDYNSRRARSSPSNLD